LNDLLLEKSKSVGGCVLEKGEGGSERREMGVRGHLGRPNSSGAKIIKKDEAGDR